MAAWVWRLEKRWQPALAISLSGLLSMWLLPLFFYRFVYYQINIDNIYVARLPLYYVLEEYASYYVPFLLLLLFFVVVSLIRKPDKSSWLGLLVSLFLLLAASIYTYRHWYHDENFHHELAMQRCIDGLDWEGYWRKLKSKRTPPHALL